MSYSELQNDVRKSLALNLLENETLALEEIAFAPGTPRSVRLTKLSQSRPLFER